MRVVVRVDVEEDKYGYWSGTADVQGETGIREVIHEEGFPSKQFAHAMMRVLVNEMTETLTWGRVEAEGSDWIVVRESTGTPNFAQFSSPSEKNAYLEDWFRESDTYNEYGEKIR